MMNMPLRCLLSSLQAASFVCAEFLHSVPPSAHSAQLSDVVHSNAKFYDAYIQLLQYLLHLL